MVHVALFILLPTVAYSTGAELDVVLSLAASSVFHVIVESLK